MLRATAAFWRWLLPCCGTAGVGYTAGRREVDRMRMRMRMRVRILCREGRDGWGIASYRIASPSGHDSAPSDGQKGPPLHGL
jgi:hypothetical protein